jgi:thiol:disulfide interchange protein
MHTLDQAPLIVVCLTALLVLATLATCGVFALRERRLRSQKRNMAHIRNLRRAAGRHLRNRD